MKILKSFLYFLVAYYLIAVLGTVLYYGAHGGGLF